MNNNDVLKKLRVALKLKDNDVIDILKLVDFQMSKTELSAIYRSEDHPNYKECGDQLLRNFLNGLIIRERGELRERPKTKSSPRSFSKKKTTKKTGRRIIVGAKKAL